MAIIYEKTPSGLITSSDRQFTTFQSGLIRVDQKFTCVNDAAEFFRVQLRAGEKFPGIGTVSAFNPVIPGGAVDDYYIFPEPQITNKQNGFSEITLSGYSRTRKEQTFYNSGSNGFTYIGVLKSEDMIFFTSATIRYFGYWSEVEYAYSNEK